MDEELLVPILIIFILIICYVWGYKAFKNCDESASSSYNSNKSKFQKYLQSNNPQTEESIFNHILSYTDEQFNDYLLYIEKDHNWEHYLKNYNVLTKVHKRSLYNVINKHILEIPKDRLKKIEQAFPRIKRVYFGSGLNKQVYNKQNRIRQFKFLLKPENEVPQLKSIIDLALFFNLSINKILGYCHTRDNKKSTINYNLYEKLIEKFNTNKIPFQYSEENQEFKKPIEKIDDLKTEINLLTSENTPLNNYKLNDSVLDESNSSDNISSELSEEEKIAQKYQKFFELSNPFYFHSLIPKNKGGKRLIAAPNPKLKAIQHRILHEILEKFEMPEYCTGFITGRSILDNANIHIRARSMVKIDLKNFFPSLNFSHVFEVFRGMGYNRSISGILACLCTDYYQDPIRYAPQGAPTSPMIGNLYALKLDKRLKRLWEKQGFQYSRYADDLTFSSKEDKIKVRKLIISTYQIIKDEKLIPNYKKTKVFRKGNRKEVTGIVVNDFANINHQWLNQLRGDLYRYNKFGFSTNEVKDEILSQLHGKIAFLKMVNPHKAEKFRDLYKNIKKRA